MRGLDPRIHVFTAFQKSKTWIPAFAGMTHFFVWTVSNHNCHPGFMLGSGQQLTTVMLGLDPSIQERFRP